MYIYNFIIPRRKKGACINHLSTGFNPFLVSVSRSENTVQDKRDSVDQ